MSGDWIKMRLDLREDPAVYRLARITKLDKLSVVGRLYAFWSWADKHAVDGVVDGASSSDVDDIVECDGFAAALVQVKWLEIGADLISIPKHERHNGESAKERGLKNARQARWRVKVDGHVDGVEGQPPSTKPSTSTSTKASTREEKRRSNTPPTPKGATVHGFPPGFEAFWAVYPNKAAKKAASKAFAQLRPDEALQARIIAAVERQKATPKWRKSGGEFIPNASTWLNGARWEDEVGDDDAFAGAM